MENIFFNNECKKYENASRSAQVELIRYFFFLQKGIYLLCGWLHSKSLLNCQILFMRA